MNAVVRLICIFLTFSSWGTLHAAPVAYPLLNASFEAPQLSGNNYWFPSVGNWGTAGNTSSLGTRRTTPSIAGHPAPNGNQYLSGPGNDWHVFQQTGTLKANTRYWLKVDLFPLPDSVTRAELSIEETDTFSATFATAAYQPTWDPAIRNFQLPPGQWTTVTLAFNSMNWSSMVGRNFRIRVRGSSLAVDNVRLTSDNEVHSFHISNSGSDTANNGFSEASPWKTFGNLKTWMPLMPGERVLLKRGDTFTEELHLEGKGTADAPIELTAFGSGSNPVISRSDLTKDLCIVWEKPSYVRINQIDCRNSKMGIYLRYHYPPTELAPDNFDVRIDRCNFKDMTDGTLDPSAHDYEFAFSDAIFLGGHDWKSDPATNTYYTFLDGLRITNCVAENCAHGFGTGWYYPAMYRSRLKNLIMEDNLAINCLNGWASLINVDGGWMKRCHSLGGGGRETWAGTTLGMIQSSQNYLIQDCVFAYCDRAQAGDGCGMDFEGNTINVTFDNNTVHNNDASGLLILSTEGPNQNLTISNNLFYGNARNPWNSEINSEIQGSQVANASGTIVNNSIYRSNSGINFFSPGSNWSGFTISGNRQSTYVPAPRAWNFNHDTNSEGWGVFSSNWINSSVGTGKLQGTSSGVDPYVHSPAVFIDPQMTPYVWIRMKTTAGNIGQIFYITDADPAWTISKSVFFTTTPDGQFRDYFIDLLQAGARSVITQFRLDPTSVAGSTIAVDFIRLANSTDPNQPPPLPLPPTPTEVTFVSSATEDGHVLESAQNSSVGGSRDSTSTTFRLGDDVSNRAFRPILSFDTSSLPDGATVTEATLGITRIGDATGTIPIGVANSAFGDILVDVVNGSFNNNASLENADWQAASTKAGASKFAWPAYSNLMTINSRMETADLGLLNKVGRTQFRIRYQNDDDNDATADSISYASSNNATAAYRPTLRVKYLTNQPPAFAASPYVAPATANTAFSGQLSAADPDGSTLTYAKISGPNWLTISPTGSLSGTPTNNEAGSNSFTARVTDSAGAADYATLEIEVTVNATISLGNLAQTYDGTPKAVTFTTNPANLSVALTYNGSPTAPTNIGSYQIVATITSPGHQGSASGTLVISPATPDANGNGILDTWEIAKFGNANPGSNPANHDPDADGLVNLMEFALDTHPLTGNANPILVDYAILNGQKHLRLRVTKNPAASDLNYVVEVSADLKPGSWSALDTVIEETSATRLTVRDQVSIGSASRRFIRLKVSNAVP